MKVSDCDLPASWESGVDVTVHQVRQARQQHTEEEDGDGKDCDDDDYGDGQGGRTWQAFGGGKNGHETFRQARIYNFHDKCVVFARNLKFANLTQ